MNKKNILFAFIGLTLFLSSCVKEPLATKLAMQGNWVLVKATDAAGNDITSKVAFPITAIQLTDDNGMLGSQSPLFTYIVYGDSKWTEASGKIGQLFDYANLRLSTGEFFVGEGQQEVFTVEAKLQATAIAGGLTDLLTIFGVANGFLQQTIYHKFTNVRVEIPDNDGNQENIRTMIWSFDGGTQGLYNYKDSQGNYVLWLGWPVNQFSRCTLTWEKRTQGVNDIVRAAL